MGWLAQKPTDQAKPDAKEQHKSYGEEKPTTTSKATSSMGGKDAKGGRAGTSKIDAVSKAFDNSLRRSANETKSANDKSDASSKATSSPPDAKAGRSSSAASASDGHGKDTPPTSDGVDVDMLSDEDAAPAKPASAPRFV